MKLAPSKPLTQILLVIEDFQPRLMKYPLAFGSENLWILATDKWIFERDVNNGLLGEALASELIFPFHPLVNSQYLHAQEVALKKRLELELLQNLVTDFPETSYEFFIKPEYFMYEALLIRARLFPPMLYSLETLIMTNGGLRYSLQGFTEALNELKKDGVINLSGGYVRISKEFLDKARDRNVRFANLFKTGQRAVFASILHILPQIMNLLSPDRKSIHSPDRKSIQNLQGIFNQQPRVELAIEDPEAYVYLNTATGLVSLANRTDIKAFSEKILFPRSKAQVKVEALGGILNDVYLVQADLDGETKKVVAKRFRDWSNFKWFPLTLWSFGTKTFTVLGSSRLEREYAINRFLHSHNITVPEILYVSKSERLIFTEYISGENLSARVKKMENSTDESELTEDMETFEKVGKVFARIHSLGVALGDAKPENILTDPKGDLYITDLEQGSRNGDKTWDIAEFLYYAGHDISPFANTQHIELMAKAFINGYLHEGGNVNTIKNASKPKYTKVFSIFTFPHIMLLLSKVCRKTEQLESD